MPAEPHESLRLPQKPLGTFHILAKQAQQRLVVRALRQEGGRTDTRGASAHGEASEAHSGSWVEALPSHLISWRHRAV